MSKITFPSKHLFLSVVKKIKGTSVLSHSRKAALVARTVVGEAGGVPSCSQDSQVKLFLQFAL